MGQGGFGITYLAHDFNLDRQVVIKEYLPIELAVRERDFSVHPVTEEHGEKFRWGRDRFITEARTLAKFKHPNIVQVLNVFEENNTAYMVMEYEHGESLQDLLSRRKTIEEAKLINILIPVLGGLQKVHEAGFIHRDIKPANIFIRKDGSPVLLDFGSARQALGVATQTLTSLVSPGYAPYEQYYSKSNQQGPWTDIYGLGATLYRAVAGMAPMDAVDRSRAILKGDRDIFVSAKEIGKGRYSERFLLAIDHALKFKEEDRPQTISAWKSEFDLPEDPIKKAIIAERISTWPGTKALGKRQQNVWLSGKVALLGLLISVAIVYFYRDEIQHYLGPTKTQLEAEHFQIEEDAKQKVKDEQLQPSTLVRKTTEALTPGKVIQNMLKDGSKGPEMVAIPGGTFQIEDRSDYIIFPDKKYTITVKPFCMSKYEITVAQFRQFVTTTGRPAGGNCVVDTSDWRGQVSDANWQNPYFNQSDTHPVVCVDWNDAIAYTEWLSEQTGQRYRLPSQAEWEYAALAGTATNYWWGNTISRNYANYGKDECCGGGYTAGKDEWVYTSPVGSFPANAFGLHDMHGNAQEWVQDCWRENYNMPFDGSAEQSGDCGTRMSRGGSWRDYAEALIHVNNRSLINPVYRSDSLGFRLVQEIK